MIEILSIWAVPVLRTISEILTATVAISAFSVFLFNLSYVRRERLARALLLVLFFLSLVFSADALEATADTVDNKWLWQCIHWTGFLFILPAFLLFSEVLAEMTGTKRWRNKALLSIFVAVPSIVFFYLLWSDQLFSGITVINDIGTTMVPTRVITWFWVFFGIEMLLTLRNFVRSFLRTRTSASRRRMVYLLISSFCILAGIFPLLLFGAGFVTRHPVFFWLLSSLANLLLVFMVMLLGYTVAVFSSSSPSRVVRLRMIEWVLRGPMVASICLGIVTLLNRGSGVLGLNLRGAASLATVLTVILLEYMVNILLPILSRNSISGYGNEDYQLYAGLENKLVYKSELNTYIEALISALCDSFQADGAFAVILDADGTIDQLVQCGELSDKESGEVLLADSLAQDDGTIETAYGVLMPIVHQNDEKSQRLGVMGIYGLKLDQLDDEQQEILYSATNKAAMIIWQRWNISGVFQMLNQTQMQESAAFRGSRLLNQNQILAAKADDELPEVSSCVRDALTHYWGGPRLSENRLMQMQVVQVEMQKENQGAANALRTVLKRAIDRLRPDGERSYTGEWTLYNILDLKFIEGLKVKEVSRRLAISEADLYRKQKVAIEEVAKIIIQMEAERNERDPRDD